MKLGYRMIIAIGLGLIASRPVGAQGDASLEVTVSVLPTATVRVPALNGFTVCVGTEARRDLYGQAGTGANGATGRFVSLPRGNAIVTVKKAGYTGRQMTVTLRSTSPTSESTVNRVSVRMSPGSGGPSCPLWPVTAIPPAPPTLDATPIRDAPPASSGINPVARAPRLGEETLAFHGEAAGLHVVTLDCRQFGTNWLMVGIQGKHGLGVDELQLVCAPFQANGALGAERRVTARHGGTGGTPFTPRRCPPGQAVTAISGANTTISGKQLRALSLHCNPLTAFGLATGNNAIGLLDHVGSMKDNVQWGPDRCTLNRPARAMKVDKWTFVGPLFFDSAVEVIVGVQLICEQPVRPSL